MDRPSIDQVRKAVDQMKAAKAPVADMWKAVTDAGYTPSEYVAATKAPPAPRLTEEQQVAQNRANDPGLLSNMGHAAAGAAGSLINGLTLGNQHRLSGLVDTIMGRGKDLPSNIEAERQKQAAFSSRMPALDATGQIAGNMAGAALLPEKALAGMFAGAGPVRAALNTGVLGAGVGGVTGGSMAAPGQAAAGAGQGMVAGGLTGLALGAGVPLAQNALGGLADSVGTAAGRLKSYAQSKFMGAPEAPTGPLQAGSPPPATPVPAPLPNQPPSGPQAGVGRVLDALQADSMTPMGIRTRLQAASAVGKPQSIAAVAPKGGATQTALQTAYVKPGPLRTEVGGALDNAVGGATGRVRSDLSDYTGLPMSDTEATGASLTASRKASSGPAYEKAFAQGEVGDPNLAYHLESAPAYADAHNLMRSSQNESGYSGTAAAPLFEDSRLVRTPTVRDLDMIKKGLDAKVRDAAGGLKIDAASQTKKEAVGNYEGLRKDLLDIVNPLTPSYTAARQKFGDSSEITNALQDGRDLVTRGENASPFEAKSALSDLSDAGKAAYRSGVQDSIRRRLMSATDRSEYANVINDLFGQEGGSKREMLQQVFGRGDAYDQFKARMLQENSRFALQRFVKGNSDTATKLAAAKEEDGLQLAESAAHGPTSLFGKGMHVAGKTLRGAIGAEQQAAATRELYAPRAGDQADAFMKALEDAAAKRLARKSGNAAGLEKFSPTAGLNGAGDRRR